MEFDRSLLDKEGAPTEEEMREYFIKNDYTTAKSDFDGIRIYISTLSVSLSNS